MNDDVKKKLINEITDVYEYEYPTASGDFDEFFKTVLNIIRNVQYDSVKHGKWMTFNPDTRGYTDRFICSSCGNYTTYHVYDKSCDYDYCPNCGAKMDLEE